MAQKGQRLKNWRRVTTAIGAFVLFFVLYILAGTVLELSLSRFFGPSQIGDLLMGALIGLLAPALALSVFGMIIKTPLARGIGIAFIAWLVGNYLVHFIFFSELSDFEIYRGLVQSTLACATAWFIFRLPPLSPPQSN